MRSTTPLGTEERPLRVAIVGSGPSGFYAAAALLKSKELVVEVDMFDRLPMPFGLVRGGVAPDHQKIKAVIRAYDRTASHPRFRFFGNVKLGEHVDVDGLKVHYDQVVVAVGAESDRKLQIPGEDLPGSHSATEFVGWYNGHPDYRDRRFPLDEVERVVVVGVGNVAMDVTRILLKDPEALAATDMADPAIETLRRSTVREVVVLGRRGPLQAKFSPQEIKEIGDLEGVEVVVRAADMALSDAERADVTGGSDKNLQKNVEMLDQWSEAGEGVEPRRVRLHFLASPTELLEREGRVGGVRIGRNRLVAHDGWTGVEPTGEEEEVSAQLVLRAVGYRGVPVPGVPYDAKRGIVPNDDGRVTDPETGEVVADTYVVGWAKRGPSGLIGTNRGCSNTTVARMVEDATGREGEVSEARTAEGALAWVRACQPEVVTFEDWKRLDAVELERGAERGKVRQKFTSVYEALAALRS